MVNKSTKYHVIIYKRLYYNQFLFITNSNLVFITYKKIKYEKINGMK